MGNEYFERTFLNLRQLVQLERYQRVLSDRAVQQSRIQGYNERIDQFIASARNFHEHLRNFEQSHLKLGTGTVSVLVCARKF